MSEDTPRRLTRSQAKNEQLRAEQAGNTESEGSSAGEERSYKKTKKGPREDRTGTPLYPDLSGLNETFGEDHLRQRSV